MQTGPWPLFWTRLLLETPFLELNLEKKFQKFRKIKKTEKNQIFEKSEKIKLSKNPRK